MLHQVLPAGSRLSRNVLQLLIGICCLAGLNLQAASFTYQGQLQEGGFPANGSYEFTFGLYSTNAGGAPLGGLILTNADLPVQNGLFTTSLDFGTSFSGSEYWLEIGVRTNGSDSSFVILAPRQPIRPTPKASYSDVSGSILGISPDSLASLDATNSIQEQLNARVQAASNLADISNSAAARTNLGALAATNGVSQGLTNVGTFTVYGKLTIATNAQFPISGLEMQDGQGFTQSGGGGMGNVFWNSAHPGRGEWQFTSTGSLSINAGYGAQGGSTVQLGSSGPTHEVWNFQYDCDPNPASAKYTGPLGFSKLVQFVTRYNPLPPGNNSQNVSSSYVGMQLRTIYTNGDSRLFIMNPSPKWQGGYGTNGSMVGGRNILDIATNGIYLFGKLQRDLATLASTPSSSYVIDLEGPDYNEVTASSDNLSLSITNFYNLTNAVLSKHLVLKSGLGSHTLTWQSTPGMNLIWMNEAGNAVAPTSLPANTLMKFRFDVVVNAKTTVYATCVRAGYTAEIDSAAESFFTSAGEGNLSQTESNALNQLILDLKQNNLFDGMVAGYPFLGGNETAAIRDLKGLHSLIPHGGITYSATGAKGDGESGYFDTGINGTNTFTSLNSVCVLVQVAGPQLPNDGFFIGATSGTSRFGLNKVAGNVQVQGLFNSAGGMTVSSAGGDFRKQIAALRTTSTNQAIYFNGVLSSGNSATDVTAGVNLNIYILARNAGGPYNFSDAELGFVGMWNGLTAADMPVLSSILNTFKANLGR